MQRPDGRIPVVVIGARPVGMQVALQLASFGVDCTVVNGQSDTFWHPRGNTHNSRTMEHYRKLGLSKAIRALGMPDGLENVKKQKTQALR